MSERIKLTRISTESKLQRQRSHNKLRPSEPLRALHYINSAVNKIYPEKSLGPLSHLPPIPPSISSRSQTSFSRSRKRLTSAPNSNKLLDSNYNSYKPPTRGRSSTTTTTSSPTNLNQPYSSSVLPSQSNSNSNTTSSAPPSLRLLTQKEFLAGEPNSNPIYEYLHNEKAPVPPRKSRFAPEKKILAELMKKNEKTVSLLTSLKKPSDSPIWLTSRLSGFTEKLAIIQNLCSKNVTKECCGNDILDMKRMLQFHYMGEALIYLMMDADENMRTVGYLKEETVVCGFHNILIELMDQYPKVARTYYGKTPEHKAQIRQWLSYCVKNIRGNGRLNEFILWDMNDHLSQSVFFGGPYRTIVDTLMYFSLYPLYKIMDHVDKDKRFNLSRWFRRMQLDEKLRGRNQIIVINKTSAFHPNYPFWGKEPDQSDPKVLELSY